MIKREKVYYALLCLAVFSAAGCGSKDASDAKTAAQTQDFKGHQPTPAELQAAINHSSQPAAAPGKPGAPK